MRRPLVVFAVLLAACSDPPILDPNTPVDPDSACLLSTELAPGVTHPEGDVLFELEHGGETRTFKVHVPAGYTGEAHVPVVFANHGLLQGAVMFGVNGSDMPAKSDEAGFIAVFPNGEGNAWNAGSCCSSDTDRDDVGFFRAMLDYLRADLGLCVDRTRVYATGYSNGGFMSYRLACEASDVFAAIAPVAGSLTIAPEQCATTQERPVPALHIHGTSDGIVAYDSDQDPFDPATFSAVDSVAEWAALAGCAATTVPASQPTSMLDTTCISYEGCPANVEVTLCTVADGGHCWFGNETCGTGVSGAQVFVGNNAEGIVTTDAVWDFLSRFSCEECGL